ncbi:MAG: hypothetical protein ABII01_02800 [Candidatus Woesearchaeota archaeon]
MTSWKKGVFINNFDILREMPTLGFPRPRREDEGRLALLPKDVTLISDPAMVFIEEGYGTHLGFKDDGYRDFGANVVPKDKVYDNEVIVQPKQCEEEFGFFQDGHTLTGWLYLGWDKELTDVLTQKGMNAVAWEKIDDGNALIGNSRLSGTVGVQHALESVGIDPESLRAAVIGRGCVGKAAIDELIRQGVTPEVYNSSNISELSSRISGYDIIVNCVNLRDYSFIVTKDDIRKMKRGAFIIDLACEGIEGIHTTRIHDPIYKEEGILFYCVNNVPSLCAKEASAIISQDMAGYYDKMCMGEKDAFLEKATIMRKGVLDTEYVKDLHRRNPGFNHLR